jgi:hypothetical protein
LSATAYLETEDPEALAPFLPGTAIEPTDTVSVRYDGPTRTVLDARLRRPGIIVLADVWDVGWRLVIDGRPSPILRANLLMRGAAVTAGRHTLVYTYEPASVRLGAWVSAAAFMALIGLIMWACPRLIRPAPFLLSEAARPHSLKPPTWPCQENPP